MENLGSQTSLLNKKLKQIRKIDTNTKTYYEKNYVNIVKIREILKSKRRSG